MTAQPVAVAASPGRSLDHHLDELVTTELARLSRRVPVLRDDHLGLVEASLRNVIDRLLAARGRARPEALAALFDLEES